MSTSNKQFLITLLVFIALFVTTYRFHIMPQLGTRSASDSLFTTRSVKQKDMIKGLWEEYKSEYIQKDTYRTVDPQYDITTSEGQSYAMLRSVWMDDKHTFDMSWQWTKQNLQHKTDALFAWKYGKRSDGSYGVLNSVGGHNSATDADTDIAVALIFAAQKWQDETYLTEARSIIQDIWKHEVVLIKDIPYITSNNIEKNNQISVLLNPSYFAPYAYRMFAHVDPNHAWMQVVDSSYEVLQRSMNESLDKESSVGLPPDWVVINRQTGALSAPTSSNHTTNYGYDALRTPWRIALDKTWYQDPRATAVLNKMSFFGTVAQVQGNKNIAIPAVHAHDGTVVSQQESRALYGGVIGYFIHNDPDAAALLYKTKLLSLVNTTTNNWKSNVSYYDSNWVWFGMALYLEQLPNLSLPQ